MLRILLFIAVALGTSGCGQKGPLRLPDAPKAMLGEVA
ncbi:MAG TPA: hypothetical protein DEX10_04295 [Betaproteobacteria bacterium]|nr:hypothetical protein [Betaproteobacteria bacterium]